MKTLIIQPPFVQLNAPYPAAYYLKSFLNARGCEAAVFDASLALIRRILSPEGIERVFSDARRAFSDAPSSFSEETASQIRRYLSQKDMYRDSIETVLSFLSGKRNEFAQFIAGNLVLPSGFRVERHLDESPASGAADEAMSIASLVIEDIADLITFVLDPEFSLIRYGESKAVSQGSFDEILKALDSSYVLPVFFKSLLDEYFADFSDEPELRVLITVPFPGNLIPALFTARYLKGKFGEGCRVVFGGGYPNTELRYLRHPAFFGLVDYLVFDRGYGGIDALFRFLDEGGESGRYGELYRTLCFDGANILCCNPADGDLPYYRDHPVYKICEGTGAETGPKVDRDCSRSVFPDYSGVDFGRYLLMRDSANPMHNLWSSGKWMKCYLAFGCYYHECAFCDVVLDHIKTYLPVDVDALFSHMLAQAEVTGVYGIHFTDEALPANLLVRFGALNLEHGRPFVFWGNIRFDAAYSFDTAAFLSFAGFLGASGGIETAADKGLASVGKGVSMQDIVRVCFNLKSNGILVHAYLITGFFRQTLRDDIDSLEMVRQLFEQELLDSAYFHTFVLTRHSKLFAMRESLPDLKFSEPEWDFASCDLVYEGKRAPEGFREGLNTALSNWMEGRGLDLPLSRWFSQSVPKTSVQPGAVESILSDILSQETSLPGDAKRLAWAGGLVLTEKRADGRVRLFWTYRGNLLSAAFNEGLALYLVRTLGENTVKTLNRNISSKAFFSGLESAGGGMPGKERKGLAELRANGMLFV